MPETSAYLFGVVLCVVLWRLWGFERMMVDRLAHLYVLLALYEEVARGKGWITNEDIKAAYQRMQSVIERNV